MHRLQANLLGRVAHGAHAAPGYQLTLVQITSLKGMLSVKSSRFKLEARQSACLRNIACEKLANTDLNC